VLPLQLFPTVSSLNDGHSYIFANDMEDPAELQLIEDWTELDLPKQVRRVHVKKLRLGLLNLLGSAAGGSLI
jgi:hypothetical protein